VAQLTADGTAGQLALQIAQEQQKRLEALELWEGDVEAWWYTEHDPWDAAVVSVLRVKLGHDAVNDLPLRTPLPRRRPRRPAQ
jgi:hypothetical protein